MNKYIIYPLVIFSLVSYLLYKYYIKLNRSGIIRDMGYTIEFVFIYMAINLLIFLFNFFNYKYKMTIKGPKGVKGKSGRRGDPGENTDCDLCTKKVAVFTKEPEVKRKKFLIDENNITKPKKKVVRKKQTKFSNWGSVNMDQSNRIVGDTSNKCLNESINIKNMNVLNRCRTVDNIEAPSYINGLVVKSIPDNILQLQYQYSKEERDGNKIVPKTELLDKNNGVFGEKDIRVVKNNRESKIPIERLYDKLAPFPIVIGSSNSKVKVMDFKHKNFSVSPVPINNQNPGWKDKFRTKIENDKLYVTRIDSNKGWGQNLILMASDNSYKPKYDDFTCPKNSGIYKMDINYKPSQFINNREYSGDIVGIRAYCKDVDSGDIVKVIDPRTGEKKDYVTIGKMDNSENKVMKSVSCLPTRYQDKEVPTLLSNVGSTFGSGINNLRFNKCSFKKN